MSDSEYALVGLIRKAQGIRGELIVEPLTDKPDVVFASGSRVFAGTADGDPAVARDVKGEEEVPTLTIADSRPYKQGWLVHFEEIQDRDSAELWRGRYLLARFSELPPPDEDEVYLHDLIGMRAESTNGDLIGTVKTFYELPQGIVLDVETAKGSILVPYRPEAIVRTDVDARTVVINDAMGFTDSSSGEPI
ncbi:MAG TPA: ribosome maturation factor RimM [Gemmatimonadaceae bacterium]|nr:ribosome maturation factor RimM [Gemmatimonadaceae bacterium]